MTRRLTSEERELWEKLRRSVRPLRPERLLRRRAEPAAAVSSAEKPKKRPPAKASPAPAPAKSAAPPLVALEERARRRIARGLIEIGARIDLHGMRQERAHAALASFLRHAQARGVRVVLVITGKGIAGEAGQRGVLRTAVPGWLAQPEFRPLVLGFEEAGRRHGGAGALYVRIRRRREASGSAAGG